MTDPSAHDMLHERIRAYRPDLDAYVLACGRVTWHAAETASELELVVVTEASPVELLPYATGCRRSSASRR
jgi:hypothetical protein